MNMDNIVEEPPLGSWARTDGEQWYRLPGGWIQIGFDGVSYLSDLKTWQYVTADGTESITVTLGREPILIVRGQQPSDEPLPGSWAFRDGEYWCRGGPRGLWSQVSERGAAVGDSKRWEELWAVPTRKEIIWFVEALRDSTGGCLADDLADLANDMRAGSNTTCVAEVAGTIEAHDRSVVIDELEKLADEFHDRSDPDDRCGGLEQAAWGWAADRLRERIKEMEGPGERSE